MLAIYSHETDYDGYEEYNRIMLIDFDADVAELQKIAKNIHMFSKDPCSTDVQIIDIESIKELYYDIEINFTILADQHSVYKEAIDNQTGYFIKNAVHFRNREALRRYVIDLSNKLNDLIKARDELVDILSYKEPWDVDTNELVEDITERPEPRYTPDDEFEQEPVVLDNLPYNSELNAVKKSNRVRLNKKNKKHDRNVKLNHSKSTRTIKAEAKRELTRVWRCDKAYQFGDENYVTGRNSKVYKNKGCRSLATAFW